jgi:hypothetical protein
MGWGEGLLVLGSICLAQLRAAVRDCSMELERRVARLSCCCKVLADRDDRLLAGVSIRLVQLWAAVEKHRSMRLLEADRDPSFLLRGLHLKR